MYPQPAGPNLDSQLIESLQGERALLGSLENRFLWKSYPMGHRIHQIDSIAGKFHATLAKMEPLSGPTKLFHTTKVLSMGFDSLSKSLTVYCLSLPFLISLNTRIRDL